MQVIRATIDPSNVAGLEANAKDPTYGAKGDGTTDDATALQAALDALNTAGGGTLKLPKGTFLVGTTLILYSKCRIVGEGQRATTIKLKNSANTAVIKTYQFDTLTGQNGNAGVYDHGVFDLTIDGNKANNSSGTYGIAAYGYSPQFRDVEITGCKGVGLFHEWGDTAAVSSDTLANGNMEGKIVNLYVHRNEGGGIDWYGPSDAKFLNVSVAKNGPASSTTTNGIYVRGNAAACSFVNCHVWGSLHKYAWRLDTSSNLLSNCEGEGGATAQVWVKAGGQVIKGGRYFTGGVSGDPPGILVGEAAGAQPGDLTVDTKLTQCGLTFARDGGGSSYRLKVYWDDTSKTVISGTQHASTPNQFDVYVYPGGAKVGQAISDPNTVARLVATNKDLGRWAPTQRPNGYKCVNQARAGAGTDLTAPTTSGKIFVVGGLKVVANETITNVSFFSGSTARVGTITHLWYALWDSSLNLIGTTADQTSDVAWGDDAEKSLALSSTWTPTADDDIYAGICIVGTGLTWPSLAGSSVRPGIGGKAPVLTNIPTTSGLTTPAGAPNPVSFAGGTVSSKFAYVALS